MKVLLIGGTGIISSGVASEAVGRGMDVWVLNRGNALQNLPKAANILTADYNEKEQVKEILKGHSFDVVVDFLTMRPGQIDTAVQIFEGKTKQYFMISSATVYKKPLSHYVITEDMPLGNVHSTYARNKVATEKRLRSYIANGFPGVIIRPSLTYSDFHLLTAMNSWERPYTMLHRMRKGKPIVVHGDGTSLWTITHTLDVARGIVGLFGNMEAVGEAFHITSDEILDWNRIYTTIAHAAGVEANLIHIASDYLGNFNPKWRESLLGDHACSAVFDNSKIKRFVPDFQCTISFEEGARRSIEWFDAEPATRELIDEEWDLQQDRLIAQYRGY